MDELKEQLLATWLDLSARLRNTRFMQGMPFNQAFICSLLRRKEQETPQMPCLSIKELGQKTKMLKSQLNRTVGDMMQKGLLERVEMGQDRRYVYVKLRHENLKVYEEEHARILDFVGSIIDEIGQDDAEETVRLLTKITACLERANKGE